MLRREIGLTEKANQKIEEQNADPKTKTKMTSLTPYLAEIQVYIQQISDASV